MKKNIIALFALVSIMSAHAATLFTEDFENTLGPEWSLVETTGQSFTVGSGVATVGPLDSASSANGDAAYIEYSYDNSVTNHTGYTGSFTADFTDFTFTPDATNGVNSYTLFELFPTDGTVDMARLLMNVNEFGAGRFEFASQNGVQFNRGGAVNDSFNVGRNDLPLLSNVLFEFEITFVDNGADNWTISSDWTITDVDASSVLGTLSSSITSTAGNSGFNPFTGSNERFRLGQVDTTSQFTASTFTGDIAFDEFSVAVIPEPASYMLMLVGLAGTLLLKRRRR